MTAAPSATAQSNPARGEAAAPVNTLLTAVRNRLWLVKLAAASRQAAWVTAGLALLVAAWHGAVQVVPAAALLAAVALVWALLLTRVALQRPDDNACALWADQHLAGASAYTTWLGTGPPGSASPPAVRRLAAWVAQQVPRSLQLLARRRDANLLARPLLAMAVCGALAGLVLTLPGLSPTPPPVAAAPGSAAPAGTALRLAEAAAAADLAPAAGPAARAQQLARALRAASPADSEPTAGKRAAAAGPRSGSDRAGDPNPADPAAPAQPGPAPAGARASATPAPLGTAAASAGAGPTQAAGGGGDRRAGDSADTRAEAGVSRVQRGSMAAQGVALAATRPSGDRRADSDQAARYASNDSPSNRRDAIAPPDAPAPAAATPPPATESTSLTPPQASYVQAWMKASPRRP